MTSKEKKMKIKNVILNIIGFLTVALFLIIAILLFLAANGIMAVSYTHLTLPTTERV